jgi:hypothetical protein
MPTFYFDFEDDGGTTIDNDGEELPDVEVAEREASAALLDAVKDFARHRPDGRFAIRLRDDQGLILVVSATFEKKSMRGKGAS